MATMMGTETNGQRATTTQQIQQAVERAGRQFMSGARVDVAFGESRTIGERTLIPVAQVRGGFGGGGGAGPASVSVPGETEASRTDQAAFGGGSFGGLTVRPIAVIEVTAEGVIVRPIPDIQAIMTRAFGFATVALIAGLLLGGRRRQLGVSLRGASRPRGSLRLPFGQLVRPLARMATRR